MDKSFPHLPDTPFPGLANVNPYQAASTYDYGQWRDNAHIKMLSVPWDSGYVNTVAWESSEARDAWLDAQKGHPVSEPTRFMTSPEGTVRVPVPYNVATQCNYCIVDYPDFPVPGGSPSRARYCYFVAGCEELAPNTTELHVALDVWCTYFCSVEVSGMILARGHAPMAAVTASQYLADPVRNCKYLTAPDESYGSISVQRSRVSKVVNREVYAIVFMTGAPTEDWGSYAGDDINVPVQPITYHNGVPSLPSFAMETSQLMGFLSDMRVQAPQAFQTIGCVAFVPKSLTGYSSTITVFGHEVYALWSRGWTELELADLEKGLFKYDPLYADFAKLYTYPYAELVFRDHAGREVPVHVEDTQGTLSAMACIALAFPALNIDTYIKGVGAGVLSSLSFANATPLTCDLDADAFKTLTTWGVPTFAVWLDPHTRAQYADYYGRLQAKTAYQAAYTSATASNATACDNADDSGRAGWYGTQTARNAAQASTASALAYQSNMFLNAADQQAAGMAQSMAQSAVSLNASQTNTFISLAGNAGSQIAGSALAGAAGGSIIPGAGTLAGAVAGAASGALSTTMSGLTSAAVATNDTNAMRNSNDASNAYLQVMYGGGFAATDPSGFNALYNSFTGGSASGLVGEAGVLTRAQSAAQSAITQHATEANGRTSRALVTGGAGYIVDTSGDLSAVESFHGNAARSKETADANAARSRDVAASAVTNGYKGQGLQAPVQCGTYSGGETAMARPMMWCVEARTQPEGAVRAAAGQFARYGYALGQPWDVADWQPMRHFCYWQCSDVWVTPAGSGVSQGDAGAIRDILVAGTTVWSVPEEIGNVDVWSNHGQG